MKCGKKCYGSRQQARNSRKVYNQQYEKKSTDVYYCSDCSAYHLTTMRMSKARHFKKYQNGKKRQPKKNAILIKMSKYLKDGHIETKQG